MKPLDYLIKYYKCFNKQDGSGKISADEIKKVFRTEVKDDLDTIDEIMKTIDVNGDGEVRLFLNNLTRSTIMNSF